MSGKRHTVGKSVVRNSTRSGFILIEPDELKDADRVAKAIAICKGVSKVFVTSGRYGFVVFTRESENLDVDASVMRTMDNPKAAVARAHYVYACKARS